MHRITHRGETRDVDDAVCMATLDDMIARLGPWEAATRVEKLTEPLMLPAPVANVSTFEAGGLVTDAGARERIERQHNLLQASGLEVDASEQLYDTGTRMAAVGYETQAGRARDHAALLPLADAAAAFAERIRAEQRKDIVVKVEDLASVLTVNGALKMDGYTFTEPAVRGLLARLKSPATPYVFGLRDRIAAPDSTERGKALDKAALLDVLQRECRRFPGLRVKLRRREGLGDIFACVSPSYAPADAPAVLPYLLENLPDDCKGAVSYDPASTTWEVRADVWTPTPVAEQAVGEAFRGYASFLSRDNGTGSVNGGGGIELLRCLNASTYCAETVGTRRVHRGRVMLDIPTIVRNARRAIDAVVLAWGQARQDVVTAPVVDGVLIPVEAAIPGFYRHMLTVRHGELVGVLPGRTEEHSKHLAATFATERRNADDVTRADLANGFTRYIHAQPAAVQRDAERAIGAWLTRQEPVAYAS